MAQKRRGLGRGLQALIPEAQKEKVPAASRPSDVFFPDSRKDESRDDDAASHAKHVAEEPESASEARSTRDLTATLLAPSQRKRGSKSRSTRSTTACPSPSSADRRESFRPQSCPGRFRHCRTWLQVIRSLSMHCRRDS